MDDFEGEFSESLPAEVSPEEPIRITVEDIDALASAAMSTARDPSAIIPAAEAVKPNGIIILCAQCADGLG